MNLFGVELKWNGRGNKNGKYVRQEECHQAQDNINRRLDDFRDHMDTRFNDIKDLINAK